MAIFCQYLDGLLERSFHAFCDDLCWILFCQTQTKHQMKISLHFVEIDMAMSAISAHELTLSHRQHFRRAFNMLHTELFYYWNACLSLWCSIINLNVKNRAPYSSSSVAEIRRHSVHHFDFVEHFHQRKKLQLSCHQSQYSKRKIGNIELRRLGIHGNRCLQK